METIKCPNCAREAEFKTWSSLNVTLDPLEKKRLISRELFQFKCPGCSTVTDIVYPMLYHDMTGHQMIFLIPDAPDGTPQPPPRGFEASVLAAMAAEGYRFRIVGSQNDLVEKILIFDAGLEDGPMEMVKLALRDNLPPELAKGAIGAYFSRKIPADAGKGEPAKLEFVVVSLEKAGGAEVAMEPIYGTMQNAWRRIAPGPERAAEWLRIDRTFVTEALARETGADDLN